MPAQVCVCTHGESRDQLFKADVSDEGCSNIHLLITQMESVCFHSDEDRLGTDSENLAGVSLTGQGDKKEKRGFKKKIC